MRRSPVLAALVALAAFLFARADDPPRPGAKGNTDNVKYIGKSDPKGNPVRLAKATGHVSNYDEAKVPLYSLPDPLVFPDGAHVATANDWERKRRPQILKFYESDIYGRVPDNAPKVTWEVVETDRAARDGTAVLRRVVGRIGDRPDGPKMTLTIFTPSQASGPVPVLLSLTFGFPTGKGPPKAAGAFDPVVEVLKQGWSYATVVYTEIQPDRADRWADGVIGQTLRPGQTRPDPDEWGTISAWA